MLESILSAVSSSGDITAQSFILCTLASLFFGLGASFLYMFKNEYSKNFVITLALLPAIVQIIIMLVNGNLGTGLAVMGTFSLVRFRSVPGSAKEIGSIFLAMAIGLGHGHRLSVYRLFISADDRRYVGRSQRDPLRRTEKAGEGIENYHSRKSGLYRDF